MRRTSRFIAVAALAASGVAMSTVPAGAASWEPPPGYVFQASYFGGSATGQCDQAGAAGISTGQWVAYVCHDVLRKVADVPLLYGDLYVKR